MQELINNKIKELTENGKLDEIVTKKTSDFIESIIKDVLCSYGDVGKSYKEKLEKNILNNLTGLDFVSYSKTITDLIEAELNNTVMKNSIEPIKEVIASFTGSLVKKEWKLSEVIEKYKDDELIPDDSHEEGEIAFFCNKSDYGTYHIYFDEDGDKTRPYNCKYRLMIDSNTKKLYSPSIDGMPAHPIKEMGGLYGFDLFLFKLYATGCTIECDQEHIEKEWSTYDY